MMRCKPTVLFLGIALFTTPAHAAILQLTYQVTGGSIRTLPGPPEAVSGGTVVLQVDLDDASFPFGFADADFVGLTISAPNNGIRAATPIDRYVGFSPTTGIPSFMSMFGIRGTVQMGPSFSMSAFLFGGVAYFDLVAETLLMNLNAIWFNSTGYSVYGFAPGIVGQEVSRILIPEPATSGLALGVIVALAGTAAWAGRRR